MHLALSPPPPLRRTINYDDIKNVVKLRSLLRSFWSPSASVRARARHPLFFLSFFLSFASPSAKVAWNDVEP